MLPGEVRVRVASIPALAVLKVTAWQDRKHTSPGRDATDLLLILRNYLDCGNLERMSSEHADLLSDDGFEGYREVGARLLARDVAAMLDARSVRRVVEILAAEADEEGPLLLAKQSGHDLEESRKLIEAFCNELAGAMGE